MLMCLACLCVSKDSYVNINSLQIRKKEWCMLDPGNNSHHDYVSPTAGWLWFSASARHLSRRLHPMPCFGEPINKTTLLVIFAFPTGGSRYKILWANERNIWSLLFLPFVSCPRFARKLSALQVPCKHRMRAENLLLVGIWPHRYRHKLRIPAPSRHSRRWWWWSETPSKLRESPRN